MIPSMMKIQRQPLSPAMPAICISCAVLALNTPHKPRWPAIRRCKTHSISQDTSKGRGNAANQVEGRVTLAKLICRVSVNTAPFAPIPGRACPYILCTRCSAGKHSWGRSLRFCQHILTLAPRIRGKGRKRTSFQDTEQDSQASHLLPILHKAHSDHAGAPEDGNHSQMSAGSKLAHDDGRRRLEDDIGDEEDERDDALVVITSSQCPESPLPTKRVELT